MRFFVLILHIKNHQTLFKCIFISFIYLASAHVANVLLSNRTALMAFSENFFSEGFWRTFHAIRKNANEHCKTSSNIKRPVAVTVLKGFKSIITKTEVSICTCRLHKHTHMHTQKNNTNNFYVELNLTCYYCYE